MTVKIEMNILFTSEAVVEICNGKYYKTNSKQFIDRYHAFGHVIFCAFSKEVKKSKQPELKCDDVEYVFLKKETSIASLLKTRKENQRILRSIIPTIDIVVAHLPSNIGMEAITIAKEYGKPYLIGVVGCAWDAYWNYGIKGKLFALPYYLMMRKYVKEAKYVFYVTQKFLQNRYPNKNITMGCSNVEIPPVSDEILKRRLAHIQSIGNIINIVTCANIEVPYKGQQYVISAIAKLNKSNNRKYHYYLVGGGSKDRLMKLTHELGMKDYVHFMGMIPHENIFDFLDSMDVYIQPSRQEGLPRAVIEALSRAMPTYGAKTAGIPELLLNECVFDNCAVDQIQMLLQNLDKEKMIKYANRNFEESQNYTSNILNKRRNNFFEIIKKNENLNTKI